jgi:hypothetical protein
MTPPSAPGAASRKGERCPPPVALPRDRPSQISRSARSGRGPAGAACAAGVLAALVAAGCGRCDGDPAGSSGAASASAASAAPVVPPAVPPPSPWAFASVRGPPGIAAPELCRHRAPLLRAKVAATTHFAADVRSLGLLAVAETQVEPLAVVRSGLLSVASDGKTAAGAWLPWPFAGSVPRLARAGERWVLAWDVARGGSTSAVVLFRGGAAEAIGAGDAFAAADLACGATRCALLTSRPARVAPAGANVVLFEPAAGAPLRTVTIEPGEADGNARPFGLAAVDGPRGAVAVLAGGAEATSWSTEGEGAPAPFARVPAEHGVLDATLIGDRPVVMAHGNVVDELGCAREGASAAGARIRFVRPGEPASEVVSPGAPALAALRPLASGALAVWLSPLGCGAERRVVYAVVLGAGGAPASAPLPVGDAETFVVAASGADVDLWMRRAEEVSWVRLTCAAP